MEEYLDCELAPINVFHELFPEVFINLCFFHVSHNGFNNVGKKGLLRYYKGEVKTFIRMLWALAFLPIDEVNDGLHDLKKHFNDHTEDFPEAARPLIIG